MRERETKMEGEQLILIELLVDTVNIPTIRAVYDEILPAKTCVSFQVKALYLWCFPFSDTSRYKYHSVFVTHILNLPPINIYQETPTESCACIQDGPQVFKKGKSCLFALSDKVLQKPLCNFPITMSVYKELPPGVLPDVMLIGTHQIQLHSLMNSLLSMQVSQHSKAPCRTMKNAFKITTATGQHVGEVTVFIRVSCFGKKIVTQFQLPHNKKPYLFKGVNNGPVYQCKRVTSALDRQQIKCVCSPKNGNGSGEAARSYSASADERRRKRQLEDIRKDKCPPCCRGTRDIVKSKETVRKCGCVVKEERTCNCARSNIKYST